MSLAPPYDGRLAFVAWRHPLTIEHSVAERLRLLTLWLMMVGSGLVMSEPSLYEVGAALALPCFFLTGGLGLHRALMPLAVILFLYVFGLTLAMVQVAHEPRIIMWSAVSWYLAITALFFAALALHNTEQRLQWLISGWVLAALIVALTGILAYLHLIPMSELFLRYGRAKGTFNDPNLLGPFLVFPALIMVQRVVEGMGRTRTFIALALFGLFALAVLLSFSRAAWAHFIISMAVMVLVMLATSHGARDRLKLALVTFIGLAFAALLIGAMLQVPAVAELMSERASLNQSYDVGPMGRFGRHELGWLMAYDRPFGHGPLQFATYFPEDAHNVYLNSFFGGGYLAGIAYLVLVWLTLAIGLLSSFRRTPWQKVQIALFATFVGVCIEGQVIDSEHWRHFYVLLGLIWSLGIAATLVRPVQLSPVQTVGTR